jgi:hypothetical protein
VRTTTKKKPCPNCGGPRGYPSDHGVGCPVGAIERWRAAELANKPVGGEPDDYPEEVES